MKRFPFVLHALLISMLASSTALAEVYRYKDANGNWQFSDRPPTSQGKQQVERLSFSKGKKSSVPEDIREMLTQKFNPGTVVEKTTLAVVSVETKLGSGSGFFVTEDGYLVTNKHVVRPTENGAWKEQQQDFDEAHAKLKLAEERLAQRRSRISRMETELEQYKKKIEGYGTQEKELAMAEYDIYYDRYSNLKRDYNEAKKQVDEQRRALQSASSDFDSKSISAKHAQQFKITLKDGTNLTGRLVTISKDQDLALLKVNNYITPYLNINHNARAAQGAKVYAVGSPLGLKDFVTSGIITARRREGIFTDTQILPGNSGGPLIDEEGNVLGVNTQKLLSTQSLGSEGFGVTIPVDVVLDEFGQYLSN